MDVIALLKKFFPLSFSEKADITALVINVVIYFVVGAVSGIILGLMAGIEYVGFIFGITAGMVGLYCTGGIALSFLDYFKVIK